MKLRGNALIFLIISTIMMLCMMKVYGDKNYQADLVDIQVEYLLSTEQEVLENYEITGYSEIVQEEMESSEIVSNDDSIIENAEDLTVSGIEEMKIIEVKEEYSVNNRASYKDLGDLTDDGTFLWPVTGYRNISSPYGWRICPFHGREFHSGIDIPAPSGTPIRASKDGVIVTSQYDSGYGNYIVIRHTDGSSSLYAHMYKPGLSVGVNVTQGQVIGGVGTTGSSTGNHLHYETWLGSTSDSRVDPMSVVS